MYNIPDIFVGKFLSIREIISIKEGILLWKGRAKLLFLTFLTRSFEWKYQYVVICHFVLCHVQRFPLENVPGRVVFMLLRVSFWRVEVSGAPGIPDVVALTSKFAGRYPPLQFMLFHEIWVFLWEREINVSLLLDCQLALLTYFLPFVPPPSGAFLRHLKLGNNPYCHVNKLSCGITLWLRDKCCVIQIVNRSLTGKNMLLCCLQKGEKIINELVFISSLIQRFP